MFCNWTRYCCIETNASSKFYMIIYIFGSGKALSALGKKEEALNVWEQGHEIAVRDTMDLKQLLELEELVSSVKICETIECEDRAMDTSACDTKVVISEDRVVDTLFTASTTADTKTIVCEENIRNSGVLSNGEVVLANDNKVDSNEDSNSPNKDTTETHRTRKKTLKSDKKNKAKGRKEINGGAEDLADNISSGETVALDQRLFATKILKSSKSISLDFRLSRGIAQVTFICYDTASHSFPCNMASDTM
ncbi:hypothetical protein GUJ93_ZPchr0013g36387 [Zizania palustris]|uniref:Uncharacterized protein n=1 Tax=Zizania palustris TaxID=103762 RepID=A0A8J5X5R2_ZIZPA|nr:hypothetical protein GUJ93_ZPchr0013g36387 [Zizania palustris]KAG8100789.1 hypothetical protein GUJ93_ZPchr0013g36387 [Zizania palustris]